MDDIEDDIGETATNSAATTQNRTVNEILNAGAEVFKQIGLTDYLDPRTILTFSKVCTATQYIVDDALKALKTSLLKAVAEGDEALARETITDCPQFILDSSATVIDLSGKEIQNLTPLQAAICAGDVEMIEMMIEVLQQKLRKDGKVLGCKTKQELDDLIQDQFEDIYPDGIDAAETAQKTKAQQFETSTLNNMLTVINAATDAQVLYELNTPGTKNLDSPLNTALHEFREQFSAQSNQELIFNPFYLLSAFEFLYEKWNSFNSGEDSQLDRRRLFGRQVIGYIQRHLTACYLQAFAQGIYFIVEKDEPLKRDFEFRHDKSSHMRPVHFGQASFILGYHYAGLAGPPWPSGASPGKRGWCGVAGDVFSKVIADKKIRLGEIIYAARRLATSPALPIEPVRNRMTSCCNIC